MEEEKGGSKRKEREDGRERKERMEADKNGEKEGVR
jgi:hypothetical protein